MKKLIIDYRASDEEKLSILNLGYKYIECPHCSQVYEAICGHPDILLHIVDNKNILIHKDIQSEFVETLKNSGINVIYSSNSLDSSYPLDITLNAVNTSNFFMHYLKYTDSNLLQRIKDKKKLINVKQGYTKCSTAIVSPSAFITSDKCIAQALHNENMDVLLLPPGDIALPGLNYGFIGGCCGLIEDNILAFFGDLQYYAYGNEVLAFLKKNKVEPYFLKKGKLTDRGSLFVI
ncbi:hypothetical protein RBU49_02315 [Clostridium sp. MB40-C1]|uniref:DUF6873 family GME fold protein n=1 Tax=Clostridium sp. MB40-C1 TaxID=3070996 RepID=UPI0027E053F5|nr:hypothetical protein [Clostridium sp. MB40-C1]WMJ81105.1 hypothetical protein RBU49_02315 [Clostridium sp. MB40-C1]